MNLVGPLAHSFLLSCKDIDATLRASGLSNIAELCKMLRYGIHPYLVEIVECVSSLSIVDSEVEVKRGCIFVIYLLLEGMGVEAFEIIPDHLRMVQNTIRRFIKDNDAVVQYHAENANNYFKEILQWKPEPINSPLNIIKY